MTKQEIMALQRKLRAAGYDVAVDGVDGAQTRQAAEAYEADQRQRASENLRASDQAKAATAAAQAEAAKAQAEAARQATEVAKIQAAAEKDRIAADGRDQTFSTALTGVTYAGGLAAGILTAKSIDKKLAAGIDAKNQALAKVAKQLKPMIKSVDSGGTSKAAVAIRERTTSRIAANVTAADKTGITNAKRGMAGPAAGLALVATGLLSRALADRTDSETQKTVLNATGTAEAIAGLTVIGKDLASRAAPQKLLDAADLAIVEEGRAISSAPASKPAGLGAKVLKVAGRIALPILALGAGAFAARAATQEGRAPGEAAAAGAKATADVVTAGGPTFYDQARDAGLNENRALGEAIRRSAANFLTLGLLQESLAIKPTGYLNADAASKAQSLPARARRAARSNHKRSDGMTAGYTRTRTINGVRVTEQVGSYRTPKR